jgi:integrase/recombinase XerC
MSCRGARLRPATVASYRSVLRVLEKSLLAQGVAATAGVTIRHLLAWQMELEQRVCATSMHDYTYAVVLFFKWAHSQGIIGADPAATLKVPKAETRIVPVFGLDQLQAMVDLCEHDAADRVTAGPHSGQLSDTAVFGLRNEAMLLVLATSGLRRGELADMRLDSFLMDFTRIKVTRAKNHKERVVALDDATQRAVLRYVILRRRMNLDHDFVWVGKTGKPLTGNGVYQALRGVGDRAGVDVRRFVHALRHTAGTRALLNGATERDVQDMLGQDTVVMVQHYTATIGSERAAERHSQWSPTKGLRVK